LEGNGIAYCDKSAGTARANNCTANKQAGIAVAKEAKPHLVNNKGTIKGQKRGFWRRA
jgi:hypothetical protein